MKEKGKSKKELREEAVETLYQCLQPKHDITKEECYEIYDKMRMENTIGKNDIS
ncbi:MAG: hypothetical protein Tsb0034_09670 [Ekhidna sp.]